MQRKSSILSSPKYIESIYSTILTSEKLVLIKNDDDNLSQNHKIHVHVPEEAIIKWVGILIT